MKRYKDILCAVEPGVDCKPALERAVALAENNQAGVTVVDVIERVPAGIRMPAGTPTAAGVQAAMLSARQQRLETLVEPYRKLIDIQSKLLKGIPFLEIVREVLRGGHDLVIKAPETRDWLDRVFGSDDMHLLRKCPCPVWLVKPDAPKSYRRILAAVDVAKPDRSEKSQAERQLSLQILEMAGSLALSEFGELHVVHVWDAVGESVMRGTRMSTPEEQIVAYVEQTRHWHEQSLQTLLREVTEDLGTDALDYLKPRTHLIKGWARKEIPALAKQIDAELVVMGTVARTGIPGLIMGNTAETILNQIVCSVLAIKPPGFVTPVTLEV